MSEMTTTAIANWYGSNRMLAAHVGAELAGCAWVGVVFGGGMCEVPHIAARSILVNDKHRHVINLARVAKHKTQGPKLYRALRRFAFHPDELADAQARCLEREELTDNPDELFARTGRDHRYDDDDRFAWTNCSAVSRRRSGRRRPPA